MVYRFVASTLLVLGILLTACHAQTTGNFQSVGEDFGQSWLKNFQAQNPAKQPQAQNSTSLWSWGGAPKGSMIQNGSLVSDPYYIWKSLNYTSGWLGQVYVDPKTGYPIYGFLDPYTGYPVYFYIDPNTGQPIFTNSGSYAGNPYYGSVSPYYSSNFGMPASAYYPWLNAPALPYSSIPNYDYLGRGLGYF